MDLYLETFDLADLLQDVRPPSSRWWRRTPIPWWSQCADDLGTMRADQTKVRQALFNLLSNACKFTEHGTSSLAVTRQAEAGATGSPSASPTPGSG